MYIPFYYITGYSLAKEVANANLSFYLLTIINTGFIFGRLLPNYIADITSSLNVAVPYSLICGIIAFAWTFISSL